VRDHFGVTLPFDTLIAAGRDAFERGDGPASRRAFEAALAVREEGQALEGLAKALYLEVDYPASIAAHERAYAAYRREGNALGAARAARIMAWIHTYLFGDSAVGNGWLARARALLETAGEDSAERGWLEVLQGAIEEVSERREAAFRAGLDIGRHFGDMDLVCEALGWLGIECVRTDRVEEGMRLLDEALAAVCAGEARDLYVIESTFCGMFLACEWVHDLSRAEQWVRAGGDVLQRRNLIATGASCRAHYAGLLTAAGRWSEAEVELTEAIRILERAHVAMRGDALVRLAELRVQQGRLEEAEQLLDGLDQHPEAERPLAALRLARGEFALARDLVERALARSALDPVVVTPLLALLVDVQLADGDVDAARVAAERLADLADRHPGPYLRGCAAVAEGKVCIASRTGDARAFLHEALSEFARAQMPGELARARLELAKAVADERPEVAVAEAKAALEVFERLEAAPAADAAALLLRSLGATGRTGAMGGGVLTKRETEVLALLGHGLSNAEIASRLFISSKTVEHHVGRVLSKLGLRNRAEAAVHAARGAAHKSGAF